MGSVTLRDTVEYVFSDIQDFLLWESSKRDAMNEAVKSFVDGRLFGGYGEEPVGEEVDASAVVDVNVKKKETKH